DFSLVYQIDAKFLDLCCLNKSGMAEVNPLTDIRGLSPSWLRRWEQVLRNFSQQLLNSIESWNALPEAKRVLGDALPVHVFTLQGNSYIRSEVVEQDGERTVRLGIARIGRLSGAMAAEMLRA